jgi:hypothetical protein
LACNGTISYRYVPVNGVWCCRGAQLPADMPSVESEVEQLTDHELVQEVNSTTIGPVRSGLVLRELMRRERQRSRTDVEARARVARTVGRTSEWILERLQILDRLDPITEGRLATLRGRSKGGHPAPLGVAAYRVILRVDPVARRLAVLDALEATGRPGHSFLEILEAIRDTRGKARPGAPNQIPQKSPSQVPSDADPVRPLSGVAPALVSFLRRSGLQTDELEQLELPLSVWCRMLSRDTAHAYRELSTSGDVE